MPHAFEAFDLRAKGLPPAGALRLTGTAATEALPGEFSGCSAGLREKGLALVPMPGPRGRLAGGDAARLMSPAVAAAAGLACGLSVNEGPGTGVIAPCCTHEGGGA